MSRITFAAFTPKPGMEADLLRVIAERLPLLRRLGLATDRPNITVRSAGGVIIDISEWASEEAIDRAHRTPEVLALWERFSACSDFRPLDGLEEFGDMFATFEPVMSPRVGS